MPTLVFLALNIYTPDVLGLFGDEQRRVFLGFVFGFTYVAPLLLTLLLWRLRLVANVVVEDRQQRNLPYLLTFATYGFLTYLFAVKAQMPWPIVVVLGSITVSVGLTGFINLFWKVSAHSLSVGGALGILLAVAHLASTAELMHPVLALLLAGGLLMTARLHLNSHNLAQVLVGFVLGLLCNAGIMLVLLGS